MEERREKSSMVPSRTVIFSKSSGGQGGGLEKSPSADYLQFPYGREAPSPVNNRVESAPSDGSRVRKVV